MVRLKEHTLFTVSGDTITDFNSSMVRLKEEISYEEMQVDHYFNSSMVRLKERTGQRLISLPRFQFQYGAIEGPKIAE